MEHDLRAGPVTIPGGELWFVASRAGGPGGQHVNTSSTRVTLHWVPQTSTALSEARRARILEKLSNRIDGRGVLRISAADERSQLRNREIARERLAALVAGALKVVRARRATKPTRGSKERRLKSKQRRGNIKKLRQRPEA